jgi:hypothetical protein
MAGLSEGEKHFIRGGIAQDIRTDGRRRLQFRALSVETGVIPQVRFRVPACLTVSVFTCTFFFLLEFYVDSCYFGLVVAIGEWFSACSIGSHRNHR